MALSFQQVTRDPSFTGGGNRPDLTPDHQVDFEIGSNWSTWVRRIRRSSLLSMVMLGIVKCLLK
jgi:hypothetical protein